jgi:nanoRNase/pAp phosphatase (c-di-AMP/oligoRNAs hydrolase)
MIRKMLRSSVNILLISLCMASAFTSQPQTAKRRLFLAATTPSPSSEPLPEEEAASSTSAFGSYQSRMYTETGTYSARYLVDNGLEIIEDEQGRVSVRPRTTAAVEVEAAAAAAAAAMEVVSADTTIPVARLTVASVPVPVPIPKIPVVATTPPPPQQQHRTSKPIIEQSATVVPQTGFNIVLTHATADFDSLASAVGLAKLWSAETDPDVAYSTNDKNFDSASHVPTFVVLPRGAHPGVQKFLALHKHLFPIRSLKSLPRDLSGLNRLALVDAQRRDRLGPAEYLLQHAKRVTVVDHHIDQDSDIPATDYVVDKVGSVSTIIAERLQNAGDAIEVTEAEATLLALGIHADTGSLSFDSTTPRDAQALTWCLMNGASQAAIAEHAHNSLSTEQQGVLTQALMYTNSTVVHGVTVSTVLLSADGFINGLAAVTQDALELSSSDVFLLGLVYEAQSGGRRKSRKGGAGGLLTSRLLSKDKSAAGPGADAAASHIMHTEAWKGGEDALQKGRLRAAFIKKDINESGFLEPKEIAAALASSGVIASVDAVSQLMESMDTDKNGVVDFDEFVAFAEDAKKRQQEQSERKNGSTTMIIIGRVKAGVPVKSIKLNKLLEKFGGGGHPKAASATIRLNEEQEAEGIMQDLVNELVETSLQEQVSGSFSQLFVLN